MKSFSVGTKVRWKWSGGTADGVVGEVYEGPVEREIKGSKIKRNGSVEKPAYLVRSEAGTLAFKLQTELSERPRKLQKVDPTVPSRTF